MHFGSKKILCQKNFFGPNHFWLQKVGSEKILSQKKNWEQKSFLTNKILGKKNVGPENFLDIIPARM